MGVVDEGDRDVLGLWFQETEGAKFWMQVLAELKQRGVRDILICCVEGLKGFPEAIEAIFPQTVVQTCIVHLITQAWLNAWEHATPFPAFPPEVRRVIYATNAIEALNRRLREALKTKGHFPNEDAAPR